MAQIRLFKGTESDLRGLEAQINSWLRTPGIRVLQVYGNIAPQTLPSDTIITSTLGQIQHVASDIFLFVLYENDATTGSGGGDEPLKQQR